MFFEALTIKRNCLKIITKYTVFFLRLTENTTLTYQIENNLYT